MPFSSIIRALGRSSLTAELLSKLNRQQVCRLSGIPRLPKGLVASTLAQTKEHNLFVVCATLEEAGRWAAQLEAMGWQTVHFYPTSEASPYEPFDPETEMTWGQMQVLADLMQVRREERGERSEESSSEPSLLTHHSSPPKMAIVATPAALQPHLPPMAAFQPYCLTLNQGMELNLETFSNQLATLGYERVPLVEMEGQWSRRGDIVDIFPVSSELPVRLEWFGDELEQIREFDPATQRSTTVGGAKNGRGAGGTGLDRIDYLALTPTNFSPIVMAALSGEQAETVMTYLSPEEQDLLNSQQS
ncbi:MAG: transcription-repair coupling factor, partial [Chroococcidiopsidaceae cyanobacterium CP_BM_RX_35]|nr:transcription-repair coupling factor [Chroococcidiopsidaceae cyanobacterium CP_BM_RX_35]